MAVSPDVPQRTRFFRDFLRLAGPFWLEGAGRWRARALLLAVVLLGAAHVGLAIRLNLWSADFFDALERRSLDRFLTQIGIFAIIVGATVVASAADIVVKRRLALAWRGWLTQRVLGDWMDQGRHYQVAQIEGPYDNPDGRIAEDIRIATEYALDLAQSLTYALLLLLAFIGILWVLSGQVEVLGFTIPGHMVVLSILYAGAGSAVAFMLGRPLVRATDLRQTREADFRFGLVRARETGEPLALARGEPLERRRLARVFDTIGDAWRAQTQGLSRLSAFSSGYLALAPVFPILVATPRYITGTLSLGGLMQTAQAFQQVTAALSWPVDNLARIAEWRASVERVLALEEGVRIVAAEAARTGPDTIELDRGAQVGLGARGLCVAAPDGSALLTDIDIVIDAGERVLVEGEVEAVQALFRVLAGIWPWGRGTVQLPADDSLLVVGERPFLPTGTLGAALAFPEDPERFPAAVMQAALSRAGVSYIASRIGEIADWDRELGVAEMQRIAFARIDLLRPRWVLLGDTTGALDPLEADAMLRLLDEVVPEAGVLLDRPSPRRARLVQPPPDAAARAGRDGSAAAGACASQGGRPTAPAAIACGRLAAARLRPWPRTALRRPVAQTGDRHDWAAAVRPGFERRGASLSPGCSTRCPAAVARHWPGGPPGAAPRARRAAGRVRPGRPAGRRQSSRHRQGPCARTPPGCRNAVGERKIESMPLAMRPRSVIGPLVPPAVRQPASISHMKARPLPLCSPKARMAPLPLEGLRGPTAS